MTYCVILYLCAVTITDVKKVSEHIKPEDIELSNQIVKVRDEIKNLLKFIENERL